MKTVISFLFLTVTFAGLSAESFEGMYKMLLEQGRDKVPLTIWTKDNHLRMEVDAKDSPGIMVMRDGMETLLMILPDQRMYMEMPLPKDGFESRNSPESKEDEEFPFEKTGETREILGYTAHEFVSEEGKDKMVIWATEELGSMPFARNPMMKGWAGTMKKITGLSAFFPLEMTGYENGRKEYTMKVTEVEAKELEDALFEEPDNYTRMAMPGGMGGMFGR